MTVHNIQTVYSTVQNVHTQWAKETYPQQSLNNAVEQFEILDSKLAKCFSLIGQILLPNSGELAGVSV